MNSKQASHRRGEVKMDTLNSYWSTRIFGMAADDNLSSFRKREPNHGFYGTKKVPRDEW